MDICPFVLKVPKKLGRKSNELRERGRRVEVRCVADNNVYKRGFLYEVVCVSLIGNRRLVYRHEPRSPRQRQPNESREAGRRVCHKRDADESETIFTYVWTAMDEHRSALIADGNKTAEVLDLQDLERLGTNIVNDQFPM